MRILVNGYFYGGNCPPFVNALKKLNTETKLTDALGVLDEHGVNREFLEADDIMRVKLNFVERAVVKMAKKARLPFWKPILIRKAKKLVAAYQPDIILNHKAAAKAEVMLKTGFRPQLTLIYGGEIHGERIRRKELDYIFAASSHILMTTEQLRMRFLAERKYLQDKLMVLPIGNFDLDIILNNRNDKSKAAVRRQYGFAGQETIIFENRCLRAANAGLDAIVAALQILADKGLAVKMVLLRGFLGTDQMVRKLKGFIENNPQIAGQIVLIDDIISNAQILDYYFMADGFVSLLRADQCGKSISDALFSGCSLILSDLEAYKSRFGAGPCYIRDQDPLQLAEAYENLIKGDRYEVGADVYAHLLQLAQPGKRFEKIYGFIKEVISKEIK